MIYAAFIILVVWPIAGVVALLYAARKAPKVRDESEL